jgi:cyclopropane-fatty-acyl-phospholipid synthase
MQRIDKGRLRVLTFSDIYNFPSSSALVPFETDPTHRKAELRVVNESFWIRLCVMGDLGFSEAYMYGEVECDDLVSLFHVSELRCIP